MLNLYDKTNNKNYNTEFYIEMSSAINDEIKVGNIVIINTNLKKLKNGNIIFFEEEDKNIVTHRILKLKTNVFKNLSR